MTESESRRRPTGDRHGDDLRARLELVDEALLAIAGNVANGRVPGDELERDRCRLVAERIAAKGRRVVDLLARPPAGSPVAASPVVITRFLDGSARPVLVSEADAAFERERDAILAEARDREQGEGT